MITETESESCSNEVSISWQTSKSITHFTLQILCSKEPNRNSCQIQSYVHSQKDLCFLYIDPGLPGYKKGNETKKYPKICHLYPEKKSPPPIPTLILQNPSAAPPSHIPTEHRTRMTMASANRPRFRPRVRR